MAHPICRYLGGKIKEHTTTNNVSIRSLAKLISVDYMVVYRLQSGDQKSLSFFDAKKMLRYFEPENYMSILGDFYPLEVKEMLAAEDVGDEIVDLVEFTFSDLDRYRVYAFAAETLSATRTSVEKEFGRIGLEILDILLEKKVLQENQDGTFAGRLGQIKHWPESVTKEVCRHNLRLLSLSNSGSHLRNWYFGFNDEGLRKYYEAHDQFIASLSGFLEDSSLKGDIVVGSSVIMGPITSKQLKP